MQLRLSNSSLLLKLSLLFIGLGVRLYLIFTLPLWVDESISTMIIKAPPQTIILGTADPVHPPAYYLFLKLWGVFSDHLFWLRLSSILLFVFNVFLLNKIGQKIKDDKFSLILIFCYIFSGYFVIFDWQIRMYTGLLTLILSSVYFYLTKRWKLFTLVNTLGLYFDYGFFFYLAPLVFLVKFNKRMFWSLAASFLLFTLWGPFQFFRRGLEGIGWLKNLLLPEFFIPYFLGTHGYLWSTILWLVLLALGIFSLEKNKKERPLLIIILPAIISLTATFVFSYLFSPLLHGRSLQIVGLAVLFLISLGIYWIFLWQRFIAWFVICLYLLNFFLTVNLLFVQPGKLLIDFLPWKSLKTEKMEKTDIRFVVFQAKDKPVISPVIWSLKYTLWGKETLGSRQVPVFEEGSGKSATNCQVIYDQELRIYGCR